VEVEQPNDGLLIRCCRAMFDYINEANENIEFTLRLAVNKIIEDQIIDLLDDEDEDSSYMASILEIAEAITEASSNVDPKENCTVCYSLKLTQTDVSTNQITTSTLCFIDLNMLDVSSLENILAGGEEEDEITDTIQKVLHDTMYGNYKIFVIGNCSPHISAVENTQKTMEMVTSAATIQKRSLVINKTLIEQTNNGETAVTPVTTARKRRSSSSARSTQLEQYKQAVDKLKQDKKKLLLKMAVSNFKETTLKNETKGLREEIVSLKAEREVCFFITGPITRN
jgi:hypothetical protein